MTNQEIEALKKSESIENWIGTDEAVVIAELVHRYGIEAVDKACEKQIPKKPYDVDEDYGTFDCPSCLSKIYATDDVKNHSYCLICGQHIDWSEEGDTDVSK